MLPCDTFASPPPSLNMTLIKHQKKTKKKIPQLFSNDKGRSSPKFSKNLDLGLSEGRRQKGVTSHFRQKTSHSRFDVTMPGF